MKKISAIIALVCLTLTLPALGQMRALEDDDVTIKTTDAPTFLHNVWDVIAGPGLTNLAISLKATYTPSLKSWGGDFFVDRNIPLGSGVYTGIGIGLSYFNRQFYAVEGGPTLGAAFRPFASWGGWGTNIVITPYGRVFLGTPFGSDAANAGSLMTVEEAGMMVHVAKFLGGDIEAFGCYGNRQGVDAASGSYYAGGGQWIKRF